MRRNARVAFVLGWGRGRLEGSERPLIAQDDGQPGERLANLRDLQLL